MPPQFKAKGDVRTYGTPGAVEAGMPPLLGLKEVVAVEAGMPPLRWYKKCGRPGEGRPLCDEWTRAAYLPAARALARSRYLRMSR